MNVLLGFLIGILVVSSVLYYFLITKAQTALNEYNKSIAEVERIVSEIEKKLNDEATKETDAN